MPRWTALAASTALALGLASESHAGGPPSPAADSSALGQDATMGDGLRAYNAQLGPFAQLSASPEHSTRATVCAAGETLFGIDISKWQGDVDWNAVANDGVDFSFVRVSDGLNFPDEFFAQNLAQSRAAGLHTGVYQFFRPEQDVIAQADFLIDSIGTLEPGDLPPVIDVEATGGMSPAQVSAAVQVWIDRVETRMGVTPIIYSGKYFWQDNVQSTAFSGYPLWAAHYTTTGCPNIADQWANWAFWQYTDSGSVAGVNGGVDSNDFNGSLADLMELTVGGSGTCGDGTCNPGEDAATCIEDCPPCAVIPPSGMDIDEQDACFFAGGDPQYWRDETVGFNDHHWWTFATSSATPANYGVWDLHFEAAGEYEISIYVESGAGSSTLSSYRVTADGGSTDVVVNQSVVSGWHSLGEFAFAAGGAQQVRVDDNTGEEWDLQLKLVVDGLRVEPVGGGADEGETGSTESDGDTESSASSETAGESESGGDTVDGSGDGGEASASTESGEEGAASDGGEDKGCGCNSPRAPDPLVLLLLTLPALRRKRRRRT